MTVERKPQSKKKVVLFVGVVVLLFLILVSFISAPSASYTNMPPTESVPSSVSVSSAEMVKTVQKFYEGYMADPTKDYLTNNAQYITKDFYDYATPQLVFCSPDIPQKIAVHFVSNNGSYVRVSVLEYGTSSPIDVRVGLKQENKKWKLYTVLCRKS